MNTVKPIQGLVVVLMQKKAMIMNLALKAKDKLKRLYPRITEDAVVKGISTGSPHERNICAALTALLAYWAAAFAFYSIR